MRERSSCRHASWPHHNRRFELFQSLREPAWSLVVASNDEEVLHNTLLRSPAIGSGCQVIVERGFSNAGAAYNAGLDTARHDLVVFAHQDVYLPTQWLTSILHAAESLQTESRAWAVLGSFGVTEDQPPRMTGCCYSTGLGRVLGAPSGTTIPAHTLDELVLVLRRSSGLRFDAGLPGFHLYGADICLAAAMRGLESYIVPAFCIHNANGIVRMPREFWRAYMYLRRKWCDVLPVTTCCTTISKSCFPMAHRIAYEWKQAWSPFARHTTGARCEDVAALYASLCRNHPGIAASLPGDGSEGRP